jgi:hypothetical protein
VESKAKLNKYYDEVFSSSTKSVAIKGNKNLRQMGDGKFRYTNIESIPKFFEPIR